MPLGDDGSLPLSFALAPGQMELAELLVDAGADVDSQCGSMRALGWAIRNRDFELVKLLCERGAEVEGPLSGKKRKEKKMCVFSLLICSLQTKGTLRWLLLLLPSM